MILRKYVLSDFNKLNVDLDNIQEVLNELNERIKHVGCLYGEFGYSEIFDVSLDKVSHVIRNITYDNGKVYGDIKILNTYNGKIVSHLIKRMLRKRKLYRVLEIGEIEENLLICNMRFVSNENKIIKIFTWDFIL